MGNKELDFVSYSDSLLRIARGKSLYSGDIDRVFREITETAAAVLDIERSSIWLYADNKAKLRCVNLYERGAGSHSDGTELQAADFPAYFAAMEENRVIDAHDAHRDPRTREFSEPYLSPLGIASMLDAPVHADGQAVGVICQEHVGPKRRWTPEEITYAGSLADLVSHALEAQDRKKAEDALRESEERFKDYAGTSSDYFFEMDENLRFSYFSDRFTEIAGIAPEQLLGKTRQETGIPGVNEDEWRHHLADLEAHRPFRDFVHPRTHPDSRVVYLSINGVPVFDADGGFLGYRCTGADRTAEVEARQALEESEERARLILESAAEGIYGLDLDAKTTFVNPAAALMTGWRPEELIGKFQHEIIHHSRADGSPYPADACPTLAALSDGKVRRVTDEVFWRKDGTSFPVEYTATPIRKDGELVGAFVTFTDVSDRKLAERELKDAQEKIENIISNLPGGIYRRVWRRDGSEYVEYYMGQLSQALGLETRLGESSRKVVSDFILPEFRGVREKAIRRSAETMAPCLFEYPVRMPDDTVCWIQSVSVPHRRDNGDIVWDGINLDVTERVRAYEERRRAQAEAERANQAKSDFLASMSHDLRTPLNAVLGFADFLTNQYLGPLGNKKYREYAENIRTSGEHLLTLVNAILDFSTTEAGKQKLEKERLVTPEVVAECVNTVAENAQKSGIDLVTDVAPDLPCLYADRRAVKQVLFNLLSNSLKFTPKGGTVIVSAEASGETTTFSVVDTGQGIAAEELPSLTEPFTKGKRNPYLSDEGWGLGLAIVSSMVDLHDGTLDIESTLGKGTTVTVTLPNGAP